MAAAEVCPQSRAARGFRLGLYSYLCLEIGVLDDHVVVLGANKAWKLPEGEEVKWIGEKSKDGRSSE